MRHGWWAPTPPPDPSGVCDHEAPACLLACTCLSSTPPTEPQVPGLCRHEVEQPHPLLPSLAMKTRLASNSRDTSLPLPPSFWVKSTRKSEGLHQLREFKTTLEMEVIRPRTLSLRNPATDFSGYGMFSKVQRLTLIRELGTPEKNRDAQHSPNSPGATQLMSA